MPYKDKEKEREASKIRMRRFRARKKEKTIQTIEASSKKYTIKIEIASDHVLTPEEIREITGIDDIGGFVLKIENADDAIMEAFMNEMRTLQKKTKSKKSFRDALMFIPNLLSLGNDLQMLKHRGGTA